MYRKTVTVALLMAAGAFAYRFLTGVTEPDIVAYHGMDPRVGAAFLVPGDLVAMSPDLLRVERICDLSLPDESVVNERITGYYFNGYRDSLAEVRGMIGSLIGGAAAADHGPRQGIAFNGNLTHLARIEAAPGLSKTCECEMARRLNARERVCTVNASLVRLTLGPSVGAVPQGEAADFPPFDRHTIAITLASRPNLVPAQVFAACGLEMSPAAVATMGQSCAVAADLPHDVRMRRWLNAIDTRPLQSLPAGGDI